MSLQTEPKLYNNSGCGFYFHIDYENNVKYLKIYCGAGTGFWIKCKGVNVSYYLNPIRELNEYDTIRYCNKHGWKYWDMYTDERTNRKYELYSNGKLVQ